MPNKDKTTTITVELSEYALATVDAIKRKGETRAKTIDRILAKMRASAGQSGEEFDMFFGSPDRGGPSGAQEE